jgi:hypothetical protein
MAAGSDEIASDSKESRTRQAQALLTLFQADCGRAAVTLEEIKEWVWAQGDDRLQYRIQLQLSSSS